MTIVLQIVQLMVSKTTSEGCYHWSEQGHLQYDTEFQLVLKAILYVDCLRPHSGEYHSH